MVHAIENRSSRARAPNTFPKLTLTLKEIKSALNVSESRVSQIHAQAVIHLRQKLRQLRSDLGYRDGDPNVKQKYLRKTPPAADNVSRAG